jgi:hypothetical protein
MYGICIYLCILVGQGQGNTKSKGNSSALGAKTYCRSGVLTSPGRCARENEEKVISLFFADNILLLYCVLFADMYII